MPKCCACSRFHCSWVTPRAGWVATICGGWLFSEENEPLADLPVQVPNHPPPHTHTHTHTFTYIHPQHTRKMHTDKHIPGAWYIYIYVYIYTYTPHTHRHTRRHACTNTHIHQKNDKQKNKNKKQQLRLTFKINPAVAVNIHFRYHLVNCNTGNDRNNPLITSPTPTSTVLFRVIVKALPPPPPKHTPKKAGGGGGGNSVGRERDWLILDPPGHRFQVGFYT